jgi:indolepyruvate ferredoxin oxidoreductase beta subunit
MPVIAGTAEYPAGLIEKMEEAGAKVDAIDALSLAEEAGSSKASNIVLMGRFSKYIEGISKDEWVKVIESTVPAKFLEMNKKAFELGVNA